MDTKLRRAKRLLLGVSLVSAAGFAVQRGVSSTANGAPLAIAPSTFVAPAAIALPESLNYRATTPVSVPPLRALADATLNRRLPSAWVASRQPGAKYEAQGSVLRSDELHVRLRQPGVLGDIDGASSSFSLRSLGTVRGGDVNEFARAEGESVNRHEVVFERGSGVQESLRSVPGGYEQSWKFDHAPSGRGDLQVAVGFDPSFHVVRSASDGVILADASGAQMSYGAATWVDANGARHELTPRVDGARIVMTVPHDVVERSAYPAVLDPLIVIVGGVTQGYAPSAVGDATTGNYLGCWEDYTTFATPRIYCRLYTPSTNTTVAAFRVSTGTSPQFEPFVERLSGGKFVVMWRDMRSGKSQIYYSTVNATNGAMYTQDNRVTSAGAPSTLDQYSPAISCGVGNAAGSGSCLAVWGQMNSNNVSEIYESRYDFNTTTGVVASTYYQGTVEQAGNTPQTVDNYAPTVQLIDGGSGAAFNGHIVWEKMVGANIRLRSAFVGRFPSNCQCTKDSVSVSGQPAGFITSEANDQFYPSLTYVTDTGSAPRTHGMLTYVSTQTGVREVFMRSVESFMGGGCTTVALPNSMSAATQLSSGGGAKDSVSRLSCIGAATSNACRLVYSLKNGAATSNVATTITTTAAAPFFSVGATVTLNSSASNTINNARLASQINAGGNTGWLVLWDDARSTGIQTYAARINSAGTLLDAAGFKWSL